MAKVTNAFASYTAVANREDLTDLISNIDPFDTPGTSLAGRRDVDQRTFDWQTESLPAVNTSNADEEGFVLSNAAATPTVRLNNNTQISHRDATVTGSQESSNAAGKSKGEMAHQMALCSKALKRDVESILFGTVQARVVGNDSGTARKTRAFEHFVQTNISSGVSYAAPASETAAQTDGTLRTITETMFNDVLQTCYVAGAEPSIAMVGPAIKRKISAFVGRSGSQIPVSKGEVVNSVDVYRSDFGDIKIMPSRWSRARTVHFIDPEFVKIAYFRPYKWTDIAVTGDARTKLLTTEYGLQVTNEKAHGKLADVQI
jgi:hypothetical protein